jgi:hypothetical protein
MSLRTCPHSTWLYASNNSKGEKDESTHHLKSWIMEVPPYNIYKCWLAVHVNT